MIEYLEMPQNNLHTSILHKRKKKSIKKEKNKVILCNMHKKQDDNMLKYTY